MQQRIRLIGLVAATTLAGSGSARADNHTAHWAHEGELGPVNWGDLKDEYAACRAGITAIADQYPSILACDPE